MDWWACCAHSSERRVGALTKVLSEFCAVRRGAIPHWGEVLAMPQGANPCGIARHGSSESRDQAASSDLPSFRLLEAKQKLVGAAADRRIEHILGVIVGLVRQNGALAIQLEAGCQPIRFDSCRVDIVRRLGCVDP